VIARACKALGVPLQGATVAVQGYGNAGRIAADLLYEMGAKIVAVSDTQGGIFNRDGFDVAALGEHKDRTGSVAGFGKSQQLSTEEVLEFECDILIPAALENQITRENAERIRAKIVAEAANGPTTPAADAVLYERGVFVLPDVLANAGGVTVSYFEWVQDLQELFWEEDEVNRRLEKIMTRAFQDVYALAQKHRTDMRTAAYMLAIGRVAKATETRGLWP
jgi:glutamate dehydrogenase/leucine dehydrogenase